MRMMFRFAHERVIVSFSKYTSDWRTSSTSSYKVTHRRWTGDYIILLMYEILENNFAYKNTVLKFDAQSLIVTILNMKRYFQFSEMRYWSEM